MPGAPRPDTKGTKIAYALLGSPFQKKKRKKRSTSQEDTNFLPPDQRLR
jgi:hypothetical protein